MHSRRFAYGITPGDDDSEHWQYILIKLHSNLTLEIPSFEKRGIIIIQLEVYSW